MAYELTDSHTSADVGLVVTGKDLRELFTDAALGLTEIMVEPEGLRDIKSYPVSLLAEDIEELLYGWLSEVIYYKDAENFLMKHCQIETLDGDTFKLAATLVGDLIDSGRHVLKADVKAVTFYKFRVEYLKNENMWKAEVVLDL